MINLGLQRIKTAYEVLCDSRLRQLYDNQGLSALGPKYSDVLNYLDGGSNNAGMQTAQRNTFSRLCTSQPSHVSPCHRRKFRNQLPRSQPPPPFKNLSLLGTGLVGRGSGMRGRDVHLVLGLMLSETAQGAEKTLVYEAMSGCEDCKVLGG